MESRLLRCYGHLLYPPYTDIQWGGKYNAPEVNMMRWAKNKECRHLRRIHVRVRKCCSLGGIAANAKLLVMCATGERVSLT